MSRPSHARPDYAVNGRTYHHDRFGTVHDGNETLCESCRLTHMRFAQASVRAYAKTVQAVEDVARASMNREEAETVRRVNVLLAKPKRQAVWPWLLLYALAAGFIWTCAFYGALRFFLD